MRLDDIDADTPIRTRWSSDDPEDVFIVHDPATGEPLARIRGAGTAQVDAAVRTAHAAHYSWRARTPRERGRLLRAAAAAIRAESEEIARLESGDNGKPLDQARGDVEVGAAHMEMFANLCEALPGAVRDAGDMVDITMLEPYGVIAGIVPFNWPPMHAAGRPLAPALAVGNAVVIKPPEQAPLSVLRVAEVVASVLPDDVVHVLPGAGTTGAELAAHPLVGKISFTGSPSTGAAVLKTAADNLTPAVMELGGKNPLVVFDDADVESALRWAVDGAFFNAGQACTAASRLLIQASIYDEFAARFAAAVKRLRVGAGSDPDTQVGPVVSAEHRKRVTDYVEIGRAEGATVAAQAPLPEDHRLAGGYYVAPTVFTGVTPEMRIAQEEIFGPVACLIPFEDEKEAISIANGTEFGLVASVFTRDSERQIRVGRAIRASIVFVNSYSRAALGTPFGGGGSTRSGFGRESAAETLGEYGASKSLRLPTGVGETARWSVPGELFD
jgi:acyl-CoA reductase-like NAD-dependent aldehyde dehydrogenase